MRFRYRQFELNQKRIVTNLPQQKGKRHFWGQPGRDYGFYTNQDQQLLRQYEKNYRSLPRNRNFNKDFAYQRSKTQEDQKGYFSLRKPELNYRLDSNNPETLPFYSLRAKQQKKKSFNIDHNIDITLPAIKKQQRPTILKSRPAPQPKQQSKQKKKETIVLRKCRYSPTFSSSLGNPLHGFYLLTQEQQKLLNQRNYTIPYGQQNY